MSATRKALRRAIFEQLGPYGTALVSHAASGPDAARWVIAQAATGGSFRLDGRPPTSWVDTWLSVASGDQSGVQRQTLAAVPEIGALAMSQPFAAALATSVEVEASWPLPATTQGQVVGVNQLIVQALRDLWVPDQVALTAVANQRSYSLAAYPWLTVSARVRGLLDPPLISGYQPRPSAWRFERIDVAGSTPTLWLTAPYTSNGGIFRLDVKRPAVTAVSGAESAIGPAADTDTILSEQEDVVVVALLHAYRILATATWLTDAERQDYAGRLSPQEQRAQALEHYLPRTGMTTSEAA